MLLIIPKGGYTPEFVDRPSHLSTNSAPPSLSQWRTPLVRGLLASTVALGMVVLALSWFLLQLKQPKAPSAPPAPPPAVNSLWSNLFSEGMTTTVIVPDATSAMLQEATRRPVDLATYLRRSPNPESERLQAIEKTLRGFSIRRYTTFDGVSTAVKIVQLAEQFRSRTIVRYARDMTLREFSPGNVVLIGGRQPIRGTRCSRTNSISDSTRTLIATR
ncbi:MAG TPA: hypothetical protein VNO24_21220 [Blastocatellia bacterium]|nr:hypothetical protein [Blastocatellia bacterium]